jgi:ribosomal protein S10
MFGLNFSLFSLKVASEIRSNAEDMDDVEFKGYTRIPTKHLTICCRRSPCGEGLSFISNLDIFRNKYI